MYTLKSIARRGTLLGAVGALVVAAVVPAAPAFADALNPLTERSLLLSSSAPGYVDTDGSGNPTFAPAGSGPNGKQTGETFTFKMSSASSLVKGFSLQYCTAAAGFCQSPGNNTGDARLLDDELTSHPGYNPLDSSTWAARASTREANSAAHPNNRSDLDITGTGTWSQGNAANNFMIRTSTDNGTTWTDSPQTWTINVSNLESPYYQQSDPAEDNLTGKNNYVTFTNASGQTLTGGTMVQIIFKAGTSAYITNPGQGSFFVKINTYSDDTNLIGSHNDTTPHDNEDTPGHTVIDGGVTVANVMTDSIHITTKVLETMAFSVGTQNRDTVNIGSGQNHGPCDPILTPNNNRLNLGNPAAEYSLETDKAWDVNSYWRLSSNSSGGATVYYSGNTLANTVGDEITNMATETASTPGQPQFGLGFVDAGLDTMDAGVATWTNTDAATHKATIRSYPFKTMTSQTGAPYDTLAPQDASDEYDEATGSIDDGSGGPGTAEFTFRKSSLTIPEPIAQQNEQVISCATAKMRYVANIGADTPAGVYTTKINYLAAPQY